VDPGVGTGERTVFVVVKVPVLDMTAKPQNGSERVSQARLGDNLAVERRNGEHLQVRSDDGYEGWVQASKVTRGRRVRYVKTGHVIVVDVLFEPISSSPSDLRAIQVAPMGSVLQVSDVKGERPRVVLPDGRAGFARTKEIRNARNPFRKEGVEKIIQRALTLTGAPYLWGGTTPWGLDCSGLVQLAFKMGGYQLLRDADMQFDSNGQTVSKQDMKSGDLLFFRGTKSPKVGHVAMYLEGRLMIHASGSEGIVLVEPISRLQRLLVGVKRIVRDEKDSHPAYHA
jgi:hypothetical protein